jgi:hypothetical protein
VSIYLGRCGDNLITEDAEIGFPPPGDTGRPDIAMLRPAWQKGITDWRKWRDPGKQAPSQYCQDLFSSMIIAWFIIINVVWITLYQTNRLSGQHSFFVSGRSRVQILTRPGHPHWGDLWFLAISTRGSLYMRGLQSWKQSRICKACKTGNALNEHWARRGRNREGHD